MLIDRLAYSNRWRLVHPAVKGVLAGLGLVAALIAAAPLVLLLVVAVMAGATLAGARIPVRVYLRLLLVPSGFVLAGTLGLVLTFAAGAEFPLGTLPWLALPVGLSQAGLHRAGLVLSRSLGALASLYLLALTTPLTEIIALLRRLGMPHLLLELMVLAYRQLFTLLQVAREMTVAQQSRLGYARTGNSLRSMAALGSNLLLRTLERSRQLHRALVARGYEEELRWLEREPALPAGALLLAGATGALLVALALLVPG